MKTKRHTKKNKIAAKEVNIPAPVTERAAGIITLALVGYYGETEKRKMILWVLNSK